MQNWNPRTFKNNIFSLEELQKSLCPAFSKQHTKCLRKCVKMVHKLKKMQLWMHHRKDNNTKCTKNLTQRVCNERGFRILKCSWVGVWAHWAPRPPHTAPRPPPNHDCFSFVCLLGLIVHRFVEHISEKMLLLGRAIRSKFLARWRGCRRQLE